MKRLPHRGARPVRDRAGRLRRLPDMLVSLGAVLASVQLSHAQTTPTDLIVVFDGSGSMWGELDGKTKIETARDVLGDVLGAASPHQSIGLIAYGHRKKGDCGDIETLVRLGPASDTVPAIVAATGKLNPKGKTPLTESVSRAAEELRFTENAATVVLITDGLETCNADPCALGRRLEADGLDFTAHVVGFGLNAGEGEQLACLAEETGGLYLSADTADSLGEALTETVQASADQGASRTVRFLFRDSEDSEVLSTRHLAMTLFTEVGDAVDPDLYEMKYTEVSDHSGEARLAPGTYIAKLERDSTAGSYETDYTFEVPEGSGVHTIDAALAGRLVINTFINPDMAFDPAKPPPAAVNRKAWAYFHILPEDADGNVGDVLHEKYQDLDFRLPPGRYRVRGNLDRTTSIERTVEVAPGETVELDVSFDATPVTLTSVSEDGGFPISNQTTYVYNGLPEGKNHFVKASGRNGPLLLPAGQFIISVGPEGGGDQRSQILLDVPGDFAPIDLTVGPRERVGDDATAQIEVYPPCKQILNVKYDGCVAHERSPRTRDATDATGDAANHIFLSEPTPDSSGAKDLQIIDFADALAGPGPVMARLKVDPKSQTVVLELQEGWCEGRWTCGPETVPLDWERSRWLLEGENRTGTLRNDVVGLSGEIFNGVTTLYVSQNGSGGRPAMVFTALE